MMMMETFFSDTIITMLLKYFYDELFFCWAHNSIKTASLSPILTRHDPFLNAYATGSECVTMHKWRKGASFSWRRSASLEIPHSKMATEVAEPPTQHA